MSQFGLMIGDKHSYRDYHLILSKRSIGYPEPKSKTVNVFGRNGVIDLTPFLLDYPVYENRQLSFTFSVLQNEIRRAAWEKYFSEVANELQGKIMKIILDDDKNFYYRGKVTINSFDTNKNIGEIVINVDAEPYKIEIRKSEGNWLWDTFSFVDGVIYNADFIISGEKEVSCPNLKKPVVPELTCSAAMTVKFNDVTYSLSSGSNKLAEIVLKEGNNILTFTGSGTVHITYDRGSL